MDFRIENKESFKLAGMICPVDFKYWGEFQDKYIRSVRKL